MVSPFSRICHGSDALADRCKARWARPAAPPRHAGGGLHPHLLVPGSPRLCMSSSPRDTWWGWANARGLHFGSNSQSMMIFWRVKQPPLTRAEAPPPSHNPSRIRSHPLQADSLCTVAANLTFTLCTLTPSPLFTAPTRGSEPDATAQGPRHPALHRSHGAQEALGARPQKVGGYVGA